MVKFSGQATTFAMVIGAHNIANFDVIELVYPRGTLGPEKKFVLVAVPDDRGT